MDFLEIAKKLAYAIYFFILTTCIFTWAFAASSRDTFFDRSFYTGFLGSNNVYGTLEGALASVAAPVLLPGATASDQLLLVAKLKETVPASYFKGQVDNAIFACLDYVSGAKQNLGLRLEIAPIKQSVADAAMDAYIKSNKLNMSDPSDQRKAALEQSAILQVIPDSIDKSAFSSSPEFTSSYSSLESALTNARSSASSLNLLIDALAAATLLLVLLLAAALHDAHEFLSKLAMPVASTGFFLILGSIIAPQVALQTVPGLLAAYSVPPQAALLISAFMASLFAAMFGRLQIFGAITMFCGIAAYLLSKYVFKKKAIAAAAGTGAITKQ